MHDSLVIVDSAEKAEVCKKYFADKAQIIVSLLPVVVPRHKKTKKNGGGEFNFVGQPDSQAVLQALNDYLEKDIYLIFDADARSQYLAWLISSYVAQISKGKAEPKILTPLGVSRNGLDEAMQYVNIADESEGVKFYARAIFDAYLGKHLNRLIGTNKGPGNLPLNYAALTTLFLLADRDEEIKTFVAQPKWEVVAKLRFNGEFFNARLLASYDIMADGAVKTREEAEHLVTLIQDDDFMVEDVQRDKLDIAPPAPYLLAELLHDALVLEMQPKTVLAAVRRLSHGVDSKSGLSALVSSAFSIDRDVSSTIQNAMRAEVVVKFGEDFLGEGNLKILPGMIYPLDPAITADDLSGALSADEIAVYELIRSRALASQMRSATGEYIQVELAAGPESIFRVNFRAVQEQGFLQMYQGHYDKELLDSNPFAAISEGQKIDLIKLTATETIGSPAEKFTIESLFIDLADFSLIAEPAAVLMLQAMLDNDYIEVGSNGFFASGSKAGQVTAIIKKVFPRMCGINLSAYIEQTMEEAVSGRKDLDFALKQFEQTLMLQGKSLVKVKLPSQLKARKRSSTSIIKQPEEVQVSPVASPSVAEPVAPPVDEGIEPDITEEQKDLPENIEIVESPAEVNVEAQEQEAELAEGGGDGKDGEVNIAEQGDLEDDSEPLVIDDTAFVENKDDEWPDELKQAFEQALSGTPVDDKDNLSDITPALGAGGDPLVEQVETDQQKQCRVCGKQMILQKDNFGKFWSCLAFPACRHTESFAEDEAVKMNCPVCLDGEIVVKRTPTGKDFYVCPLDECDFIAWSKPHYVQCMACDSPYLVEKKTLAGELTLRCPKAGCDYNVPLTADGEVAAVPKKKKVRVRRVKKGGSAAKAGTGKKKVRIVRRRKK